MPYHSTVTVHPAFRERLRRFEVVVHSVAMEIYGRAPRKIVHMGTFNCRRIRRFPHLISEHGLGNAIDVAGFDFGPLDRKAPGPGCAESGRVERLGPWRSSASSRRTSSGSSSVRRGLGTMTTSTSTWRPTPWWRSSRTEPADSRCGTVHPNRRLECPGDTGARRGAPPHRTGPRGPARRAAPGSCPPEAAPEERVA